MIHEIEDFAIILFDLDGTILSWNKGAEKIKGYTESEIIGRHLTTFYLPSDKKLGLADHLINEARIHGQVSHVGRRVRKDGSIYHGSILITAIHDASGEVIGYTKITQEIVPDRFELGCQ